MWMQKPSGKRYMKIRRMNVMVKYSRHSSLNGIKPKSKPPSRNMKRYKFNRNMVTIVKMIDLRLYAM